MNSSGIRSARSTVCSPETRSHSNAARTTEIDLQSDVPDSQYRHQATEPSYLRLDYTLDPSAALAADRAAAPA